MKFEIETTENTEEKPVKVRLELCLGGVNILFNDIKVAMICQNGGLARRCLADDEMDDLLKAGITVMPTDMGHPVIQINDYYPSH